MFRAYLEQAYPPPVSNFVMALARQELHVFSCSVKWARTDSFCGVLPVEAAVARSNRKKAEVEDLERRCMEESGLRD